MQRLAFEAKHKYDMFKYYYLIISQIQEREKKRGFLWRMKLPMTQNEWRLKSASPLIRDFRLYWQARNDSESLPLQQLSSLALSHRTLPKHWASIRKSLWLVKMHHYDGKTNLCSSLFWWFIILHHFYLFTTSSQPSTSACDWNKRAALQSQF